MNYEEVFEAPWTRKHDNPEITLIPQAPRIVYAQSLEELIALCKERAPGQRFKAAGSHWALSHAAISDHTFIETHDPQSVHSAMGMTIPDVIPECLTSAYIHHLAARVGGMNYLVHVEAGKRIYQLYAELDRPTDPNDPKTLAGKIKVVANNAEFTGPWAFSTLGGAGGQTVVGALSTGTHGGDFDRPPIADSVLAIHLVADGGFHYWIEPLSDLGMPLVDDAKLKEVYGKPEYGGPENFKIIRDNHLFDAVLVSAGRFGIIYSVVMKAVPQYSLYERRRVDRWQNVKHTIKERALDKGLFKSEAILPGDFAALERGRGPAAFPSNCNLPDADREYAGQSGGSHKAMGAFTRRSARTSGAGGSRGAGFQFSDQGTGFQACRAQPPIQAG